MMNVAAASPLAKRTEDFNHLQTTLQSGNLASAQGAFAAFLQDVQKTAPAAGAAGLFAPGTQASKDLDSLGGALRSGNLAGARQAFATLQEDLQNAAPGAISQPIHLNRPLTHSEIANNGRPLNAHVAQAAASVLDQHA